MVRPISCSKAPHTSPPAPRRVCLSCPGAARLSSTCISVSASACTSMFRSDCRSSHRDMVALPFWMCDYGPKSHFPKLILSRASPEDLFPANTLGQKIIRYRLLHGMTRKQLAKQLFIDETTLERLETDQGKISGKTVRKVAALLKSLTLSIGGRVKLPIGSLAVSPKSHSPLTSLPPC